MLKLSIAISLFPVIALASDYPSGHQALQVFDSAGWQATPAWVRYWIIFMGISFACGLLFIKSYRPARWVVGGFILGVIAMSIMTRAFGVISLSGFIALVHLIFWSPGLIMLIRSKPFTQLPSTHAIWAIVMIFVILFSFVFDIRDATIYLQHTFTN